MSTLLRRMCFVGGSVFRRSVSRSTFFTPSALFMNLLPNGPTQLWSMQPQRTIHIHLTRKNVEERIMLVLRLFDKVNPQKVLRALNSPQCLRFNFARGRGPSHSRDVNRAEFPARPANFFVRPGSESIY